MFEAQLKEDLQIIFKPEKVTYQQPSDVKEQSVLFINVEQPTPTFRDKVARFRVTGKCTMFANSEKLTFGYFARCIAGASKELHARFHFSEIDANTKYYQNLVQRDFSFVYFYETEYDPDTGTLESVEFETIIEEP